MRQAQRNTDDGKSANARAVPGSLVRTARRIGETEVTTAPRDIQELIERLAGSQKGNATLYRELEKRAEEVDLPLQFTIERRYYWVDENGLWAVRIGHDGEKDADHIEAINPKEYLDALCDHLLEQTRKLSVANHGIKRVIRRFTRRKATWAELKQAAE